MYIHIIYIYIHIIYTYPYYIYIHIFTPMIHPRRAVLGRLRRLRGGLRGRRHAGGRRAGGAVLEEVIYDDNISMISMKFIYTIMCIYI